MKQLSFIFPFLLLACSGPKTTAPTMDVLNLSEIALRATADIETPETMVKAAFVPNYVAAWAGHIILLSDSGKIWRTSSEGEPPRLVDEGPYTDIHGLSRKGQPGVFIALKADNSISGFIESDDAGNFSQLAMSDSGANLTKFCAGPSMNSIQAIGADGKIYTLKVDIQDNQVAEIDKEPKIELNPAPVDCTLSSSENLYTLNTKGEWSNAQGPDRQTLDIWTGAADVAPLGTIIELGLDPVTHTPLVAYDGKLSALSVENGLSIRGLDKAGFIAATPYAMGSVYGQGLIVMGDNAEQRLVIISTQYASRTINPEN